MHDAEVQREKVMMRRVQELSNRVAARVLAGIGTSEGGRYNDEAGPLVLEGRHQRQRLHIMPTSDGQMSPSTSEQMHLGKGDPFVKEGRRPSIP